MSSTKYYQIKVSTTVDNYQQIKERAQSLGLTTSAYLRMLAGQDLEKTKLQEINQEEEQLLPELIAASKKGLAAQSTPQILVIKDNWSNKSRGKLEETRKKRKKPVKKTVTKEAIWQFI